MAELPQPTQAKRFSRLGEKNFTRHRAHTLRLVPCCLNARGISPLTHTHGATDANGR